MPVSSLPSPYGIGSFGDGAIKFIDFLSASGQSIWQVLPLNPTSFGDSPYQSPASVAGNPYFIDLDILAADGLLTREELAPHRVRHGRVDYGRLFSTRYPLLRLAYSRFEKTSDFLRFCEKNCSWIDDYALFMALKVHYEFRPWVMWESCHREIALARKEYERFEDECGFWIWIQYEFFRQWRRVCEHAHSRGISIIGDMPIYVAHDSMDTWRAPEQFLLDGSYNPTVVAGCPPDAYAEDGQLWGNPIYNWELMRKQGFVWWIERVRASLELYDLLRIDHFRGFASFYSIPYGDTTAARGKWNDAPGVQLFDAIRAALPEAKIIAEDLGFITPDVRELLRHTGFPGMKVLQFAFYDEDNEYLPRMYTTDNCIVYTSSHDSDCTRSWYNSLNRVCRARFERECKRADGQSPTEAAIALAMSSRANLCVIAMQDYLELTNAKGRMNVPSVAEGNWSWRIAPRYDTDRLRKRILAFAEDSGRA